MHWNPSQVHLIRNALEQMLTSPVFANAERQQRFLRYVVEESLGGRADAVKGYNIGLAVFDRPGDFDPTVDSIVRVEAGRLRSKLREYYASHRNNAAVVFDLPKGCYTPVIDVHVESVSDHRRAVPIEGRQVADLPGVAVLPFSNLSSDPEQSYFADGLTDDLITALAHNPRLLVIARQSSFAYRQSTKSAPQIGAELGVSHLVEGSVRTAGRKVRVNAQLIDTRDGRNVWAQRFDRDLSDIFALQDELTGQIIRMLDSSLCTPDIAQSHRSAHVNLVAYDQLIRGVASFWTYSKSSNAEAQQYFREAIRIDPHYALAHSWLARSLLFDHTNNWHAQAQPVLNEAVEHAQLGVNLDGNLAYTHAVQGWSNLWCKRPEAAAAEERLAIGIDPNNADAHLFLSLALLATGDTQPALQHIESGMRLNPQPAAFYLHARGMCLAHLDRIDEAIAMLREAIALRPEFPPPRAYLAAMLLRQGQRELALSEAAIVRNQTGMEAGLIAPTIFSCPPHYADAFEELGILYHFG